MPMPVQAHQSSKEEAVVWVFKGTGGMFPSGVFSTREEADTWIVLHKLSGTLTGYPLDTGIYEWAIDRGYWEPKFPSQKTPEFIGRFSSAYLEHYHYENGESR